MTITTRHITLLPAELIEDMSDADAIHRQTMALYAGTDLPGEAGSRRSGANILWRRERSGIIVASDLPPSDAPDTARTFIEVTRYAAGDELIFSATFDAIVRVRGRDIPTPDAAEWFTRKAGHALADIRIEQMHGRQAFRRGNPLEQISVAGTATVRDEASLDELLRVGVGRSKTFGCGLMTVSVR